MTSSPFGRLENAKSIVIILLAWETELISTLDTAPPAIWTSKSLFSKFPEPDEVLKIFSLKFDYKSVVASRKYV